MEDVLAEFVDFAPKLARLGGRIGFDLGADGRYLIDANGDRPEVIEGSEEADCTITIKLDDLRKLVAGKLDPMVGYAMGKIKVAGSMPLALKMAGALG